MPRRCHTPSISPLVCVIVGAVRVADVCVEFDIYSQRGNIENSYVALLVDFVDRDFELRKLLVGLVPLKHYRHNGESLAVVIARRIDRVTHDKQTLAMSMCDAGGNVLNAARKLVNEHDAMLRKRDGELSSRLYTRIDRDDDDEEHAANAANVEAANVDSDAEEEEDNDDDDDEDLERRRNLTCGGHALHNLSKSLSSLDDITAVLAKCDAQTLALRNSTLTMQRLRDLQLANGVKKPLKPLTRGVTRW
jgi:hypothetical protein